MELRGGVRRNSSLEMWMSFGNIFSVTNGHFGVICQDNPKMR